MNKSELIKIITDSPSSIFTKDDMLTLANQLTEKTLFEFCQDEDAVCSICDVFENRLNQGGSEVRDLIDMNSVTFGIDHDNKIIIEDIDLDTEAIGELLSQSLYNATPEQLEK